MQLFAYVNFPYLWKGNSLIRTSSKITKNYLSKNIPIEYYGNHYANWREFQDFIDSLFFSHRDYNGSEVKNKETGEIELYENYDGEVVSFFIDTLENHIWKTRYDSREYLYSWRTYFLEEGITIQPFKNKEEFYSSKNNTYNEEFQHITYLSGNYDVSYGKSNADIGVFYKLPDDNWKSWSDAIRSAFEVSEYKQILSNDKNNYKKLIDRMNESTYNLTNLDTIGLEASINRIIGNDLKETVDLKAQIGYLYDFENKSSSYIEFKYELDATYSPSDAEYFDGNSLYLFHYKLVVYVDGIRYEYVDSEGNGIEGNYRIKLGVVLDGIEDDRKPTTNQIILENKTKNPEDTRSIIRK